MATVKPDRWIVGISCNDRLSEAAVQTLQLRLSAVQFHLPLAVEPGGANLEHVHQLRVATRRAAAAMKLYDDLLPRRRAAWIQRQLKRIRRAATEARDLDVLVERLQNEGSQPCGAMEKFRDQGAAARKPIVAVHERLNQGDRFTRRIAKLLERVPPRRASSFERENRRFGDWARRRLQPIVERFFEAAPGRNADLAALHNFRLRSKKLRYAMELVGTAFPPEFREQLYPVIELLQDKLGEINDLAVIQARLRDQLEAAEDPADAAALRQHFDKESARLERAQLAFLDWCTPPLVAALRREFDRMLNGANSEEIADSWRPMASTSSILSPADEPALLLEA